MGKCHKIGIGAVVALWAALTLSAWLSPAKEISQAERRPLQQMPELSVQQVANGAFMDKFADYAVDQFPLRDTFRSAKALFAYNVLQQRDNNGIYIQDGYLAKLEYPLNDPAVSHALKRFNTIYTRYLQGTDCKLYMTVIPDKSYYLAQAGGYPAMDYGELFARISSGMSWAQQVDITDDLEHEDYYHTDTHWRQERLLAAAETLCSAMGVRAPGEEELIPIPATQKFYGVYYGQAALPVQPETLYLMESDTLAACRVYNHETGQYGSIYDLERLSGSDPYDVYLSGPQALLTIENPFGKEGKELILFRDSFGSSLAPLLAQDYARVTLVDIRYVSAAALGEYLTFDDQDVLFAYSTLILNNSTSLK